MKILITRKIPQKGIQLLEEAGHTLTIHSETVTLTKTELINLAKQHDAVVSVGGNQLDSNFFEQCNHLKCIALMSVGYDNVDINAANLYKIPVSNTSDVLSKATSDIAFLLMLAVSRNAFNMHKKIEQGSWKNFEPTADLGIELYGKTLGVFGLGRIGIELAKKAKAAYEMKIIYHNRKRNEEAEDLIGATYVSFDELLAQSDVISIHANLSDETREIFDKTAFSKMKSSALFINTARGAVHNEKDLIEAIQSKTIWGAGLDVTNPEPMDKTNPLLNLPNVCVLPHIGSATVETRDQMALMAARNIIAALNNQKMPQVINKEVYD
ncbi:MAG: D-glycerate dehydrogenase [Pedobacter sp.]|jgi:lactate dehydrogenase-like 2-hydroxyacid dehydrogenase|uniref:2-hydroxyacid dehydrogenase n=1 Tax=Pedobacter sp. TaxID=1411316 RepID=UPI00356905D1